MIRTFVRLAALVAGLPLAALAQEGGLNLPKAPTSTVRLNLDRPLGGDPAAWLKVFVGPAQACCAGRSAIAGHYTAAEDVIAFQPAFPFLRGETYTVLWTPNARHSRKTEFALDHEVALTAPNVTGIYPSGPVIPENTLRFYIIFSRPMQPHMAPQFIQLKDAEGAPDPAAFMSFKQELWNADRTRLTVLMDPGRIKRGVAQNLELGPALEQGRSYTLTVAAGWPAALGGALAQDTDVPFQIGPPLRERPDPNAWTVEAPALASQDPLVLRFDRPFDRVQLGRSLRVRTATGRPIDGRVEVDPDARAWRFTPRTPWSDPTVSVAIDARLEDVAGNNFRETLDHGLDTAPREVDTLSLSVGLLDPS